VTLTLTFDPAIRHTVVHHSSTSTYIPNFIQIEETFCGRTDVRTDGRTDGRTDIFPFYTIRSTFRSPPNNVRNPRPYCEDRGTYNNVQNPRPSCKGRGTFSPHGSPNILVLPASNIFTKFRPGHPLRGR